MKTTKIFAYACAIALVSTVGFTSCKKDDPTQGNKTDGDQVKTEFSIALPKQLTKKRMPGTTVQRNASEFQGIADGITLVPFAKTSTILSSDSRLGSNITLDGGVGVAELGTNSSAKVYEDVDIPLSTGSFLFYGKSAKTGTKFETGSLVADLSADAISAFTFDLEPIVASASALTVASANGGKLLAYLTSIAAATDGGDPAKAWYEYTAGDDPALAAMFTTFATMHGLSSFEVERVLTDLNKSLKPISSPIATGIKAAINNATYATINASDEVELIAELDNFPQEHNLPVGSIDIVWDGTLHQFKVGAYSNMAAPDTYVYPAQLWYYANSAIKTSNSSKKTAYDNTNDWDDILALHTDANAVNTKTRAVAITNPIQYAVGRLDVQVKLNGASLADNSETVEGIATPVDCSAGFPVTAVLVGGQKNVGFDFTPNGSTEYTIYDNIMASTVDASPTNMVAMPSTLSTANNTLVLETAAAADVMIAVELENTTGVDFYGVNGQLIPAGGKFYVIASLEADDADETGDKVFKQDFTTTAKLNLKSLQYAYNTIPDLRTPQLELGFSVDLSWQNGHEYTVDIE
ncbi:MAG: hypothetical protein IJT12_02205 [Paludibacteraceae bacterium]|nr:hypothetical protein [Paludibacteraceae bacterium]